MRKPMIFEFPKGVFGYAGALPTALGNKVAADWSDMAAADAFKDDDGKLKVYAFPTFASAVEARQHAAARGVEVTG